jgi:recombinational DNA repair ATPase RecF
MTKLRALSIAGFRGARFELPIDFTKNHCSISVYGENAAGKSTVTDALEWFLLGKVDHLWREDCKEEALRNVLLDPTGACEVSIQFSDAALNGTKTLSAALKTKVNNIAPEFLAYLEKIRGERIFLRHAQITKFIAETKSKKKEEIASIIGYQDIVAFRDAINGAANTLRRDSAYTAAKQLAEDAEANMFRLSKSVIATEEDLFKKATGLTAKFDIDIAISDDPSFDETLERLRSKISKPDSAKTALRLEQLKKDLGEFIGDVSNLISSKDAFLKKYNALAKDKKTVSQLNIEQFLAQGQEIIEGEHFLEEKCPFCLAPYSLKKLKKEVEARIEKIEHIRAHYDACEDLKGKFVAAITSAGTAGKRLATEYKDLAGFEKLLAAAPAVLELLRGWIKNTNARFGKFEVVEITQAEIDSLKKFSEVVQAHIGIAVKAIGVLKLTDKEKQIIETIEQMRDLRNQYRQYKKQSQSSRAYETQIRSLSAMFEKFVPVQNSALQSVLNKISADVGSYYAALHPKENVDQVRLRIVGEEGIEFEYHFHGKPTHPPMKYLSESHLNSLGICLFLASAKLFNKVNRFLVLDDIVTSFDLGHRRRLLRLIKDEFKDWQIILLTHEHLWFEMIKRELNQSAWLFNEMVWDLENGILIAPSAADWKELIAEKRKKYDVSNDIRKLLEASLKEICRALEVKMAFRFNDENEHRMSGELLSALHSTINSKCPSLKNSPIFGQLEGSNLVATIGSHDNPADKISGGDIDVAMGDIDALINLFLCGSCGKYVEAERTNSGQYKITCKCGKKELDWK